MQLLDIIAVGSDHIYRWPSGNEEPYPNWVEYRAVATDGGHQVRIGFGSRVTYGQPRRRIVVWIDNHPHAEFWAQMTSPDRATCCVRSKFRATLANASAATLRSRSRSVIRACPW